MIRRQRSQSQDEAFQGLDISSLIDVSFLLLIYFLVTSTLDPREADLGLDLAGIPPSGSTLVEFLPDPPLITLDENGVVSMESEILDADASTRDLVLLEDRMRTYVEAYQVIDTNGSPSVVFDANDSVSGQRFIDVINCLSGVGITQIALKNWTQ